jgi:hypothetical protein
MLRGIHASHRESSDALELYNKIFYNATYETARISIRFFSLLEKNIMRVVRLRDSHEQNKSKNDASEAIN